MIRTSPSPLFRRLAWTALIAALFALNLWRAATLPVLHDEALTYLRYVGAGWRAIFGHLDANNHVLHTILCKLIVDAFGLRLLTFRAAGLLGSLLFLTITARIAIVLAGGGVASAVLFGVAAANPLVLHELPLARGYSLGLALLGAGLLALLSTSEWTSARLAFAGTAVGLSIAANLTMLFPALGALAGAGLWFAVSARRKTAALRASAWLAVPAAFLAAAILALPALHALRGGRLRAEDGRGVAGALRRAGQTNYYVGTPSASDSVQRLFTGSLGAPAVPPIAKGLFLVSLIALPVALALARRRATPWLRNAVLLTTALFGGALILAALHVSVGLPLPQERTGLAFLFVFPLAWAATLAILPRRLRRVASRASVLAGALLVAVFLRVTARDHWRAPDGAGMIAAIQGSYPADGSPRRVSASWFLAPNLEFSRRLLNAADLRPIEYRVPTCIGDFESFALTGSDLALVESQHLEIVYRDSRSDAVVAVRRGPKPDWPAGPCPRARVFEKWTP